MSVIAPGIFCALSTKHRAKSTPQKTSNYCHLSRFFCEKLTKILCTSALFVKIFPLFPSSASADQNRTFSTQITFAKFRYILCQSLFPHFLESFLFVSTFHCFYLFCPVSPVSSFRFSLFLLYEVFRSGNKKDAPKGRLFSRYFTR